MSLSLMRAIGVRACGGRIPFPRIAARALCTHERSAPDPEQLAAALASDPDLAEKVLATLPEGARKRIGLAWAMTALEDEFSKADVNKDGTLSYEEFSRWGREVVQSGPSPDTTPPSNTQLWHHFLRCTVPFTAFGMVDNGLMVITVEAIDSTLGALLGISTLAAAALGNAASNGIGMGAHGAIERMVARLGIPDPHLTLAQMRSPTTMMVKTSGGIFGVCVGCLIGMFPLLFMNKQREGAEADDGDGGKA